MRMTLPWRRVGDRGDRGLVVAATELRLRRWRDVPAVMRAAMGLRRSFGGDGAVAISIAAAPWRRTFWTLSTWTDEASIRRYMGSPAHRDVMRAFHGRLSHTRTARWTQAVGDGPAWPEAFRKLETPAATA